MTTPSLVGGLAFNVNESSLPPVKLLRDEVALPPLATSATASASSSKQVASQAVSEKAVPVAKSHEGGKENEGLLPKEGKDQNEGLVGEGLRRDVSFIDAEIYDNKSSAAFFEGERRILDKAMEDAKIRIADLDTWEVSSKEELQRRVNQLSLEVFSDLAATESCIDARLTHAERYCANIGKPSPDRCNVNGLDCQPADGEWRLVCGKCLAVPYCSRRHQLADHQSHQLFCQTANAFQRWVTKEAGKIVALPPVDDDDE